MAAEDDWEGDAVSGAKDEHKHSCKGKRRAFKKPCT